HKLTNKISLEELSQYAPEILELLMNNKEKSQVLVPKKSGLKAKEVNTYQVSDSTCTEKTIKEMAQHIPLLPSSLCKLGSVFVSVVHSAKNLSEANTFASKALRHSSDNYTSPSDRYTIVNFRRRGNLKIKQKHLSSLIKIDHIKHDSSSCTQRFGLDEQNVKVYSVLSREIRVLDKKLDNYYFEYNSLKKMIKKLKRDVGTQKIELEYLDECVDRDTVVNLIYEIVFSLINEKGKSSSYSFNSSNLVEMKREQKAVPYKQQKKAQLIKIKIKKQLA
ncbi:26921_t:CDS:2, partial [Gigaspora margarita]